jgi:hypothetical protein
MCKPPWCLCGWQRIWWHLNVCISMPKRPLIVAYVFIAYHLFWVFSSPTQSCLGYNQIFRFTPYTPHQNHLDFPHPIMGAHLLCLESITHHNFQFRLKGFEHLIPFMVLVLIYSSRNSSRIWPTMKFFPTSLPILWSNVPCHFMD